MKPEAVNHSRFKVQRVVYNDGHFSVAWGSYDGDPSVGVRWNGKSDDDLGYPTARGRPVWFVWRGELEDALLGGLAAGRPAGTNVDALTAVLKAREALASTAPNARVRKPKN